MTNDARVRIDALRNQISAWSRFIDQSLCRRDDALDEINSLTYDGTLEGLDALEEQRGALIREIETIDRRIESARHIHLRLIADIETVKAADDDLVKQKKHLADTRRRAERKEAADSHAIAASPCADVERKARKTPASVRYRQFPDEPLSFEICLPVPVKDEAPRHAVNDHLFVADIHKRAEAVMQHAPWRRRQRRSRRYEGFAEAITAEKF